MLPKGPHVHDIFTNLSTGFLSILKPASGEKLFIECSTIDVKTSFLISQGVQNSALRFFVDAPVSGGPNSAIAVTLTFMVGGTPKLFGRAKPIFQTICKDGSISHCGPGLCWTSDEANQ